MPQHDVLDIRDGLIGLIGRAPAGGLWTTAQTEPTLRNSFALRLEENGPIHTITATVGGALTGKPRSDQTDALTDEELELANDYQALRPRTATLSELEKALSVMILTPHIRAFLVASDPQALRQARTALGLGVIPS